MLEFNNHTIKVFISQAMQNATADEVHYKIAYVLDLLQAAYPDNEFDIINQYDLPDPADWCNKSARGVRWSRLGRSIELMGDADLIVFDDSSVNSDIAPGCLVEFGVIESYKEYTDFQSCMLSELEKEVCAKTDTFGLFKFINKYICDRFSIYNKYIYDILNVIDKYIPNIPDMITSTDWKDTSTEFILQIIHDTFMIEIEISKDIASIDEMEGLFVFQFTVYNSDSSRSKFTLETDEHNDLKLTTITSVKDNKYKPLFNDIKNTFKSDPSARCRILGGYKHDETN